MKTKFKSICVIVLIAFAVVFQSCSKDDDGVVLNNENQLENIQLNIEQYQDTIDDIEVPEAMEEFAQENTYALRANLNVLSVRTQALLFSSVFLSIPENADQQSVINKSNNDTNTWVWSFQGTTLYYTVTSDGSFYNFIYDIEVEGVRRTLYEGRMAKDGTFYEVGFHAEDGSFLEIIYTKTGNDISIVIIAGDNRIELEYNEIDRSGSFRLFSEGSLQESYIWSTDGTGSFTDHTTEETFSWP